MKERLLIAGASGSVGYEALRSAKESGYHVRTLSQSIRNAPRLTILADDVVLKDATRKESIKGVCRDMDVVLSCLGASMCMKSAEKRSFHEVDFRANRNLLEEAKSSGVSRFVYLSVHWSEGFKDTAYVRAHTEFEELLRASGLSYTIVRPTGIFTFFEDYVDAARKGRVTIIGDGQAKTNPIHPADAARCCVHHLSEGPEIVSIGGPETMSRQDIATEAFRSLGKEPKLVKMPAAFVRAQRKLGIALSPRKRDLLEYLPAVSTSNSVAPAHGENKISDYFREVALN
jgi:uncharacterized protein YbjT (DUF2867 family)